MASRAYLVCHAMRIKGILGGRGRAKPLRLSKITYSVNCRDYSWFKWRCVSFLLITSVVTTIKNCICYPSLVV